MCIKLVFQLAADVRRPGGCRHLAVVCHISLRVTGPETEREAATSLCHGHGHIATMCFAFFFPVCILLGMTQTVLHMCERFVQ